MRVSLRHLATVPGFLGPLLAPAAVDGLRAQEAEPPTLTRPCHDYAELARQLEGRYAEAPVSMGLQANGDLLQLFANEAKDSWTILSVSPGGRGCIVAAGRDWLDLKPRSDDPEA
ncbi:MAG: hypothetical protein KDE35_15495 [Geminicoccaceae bacterium]|nr:hypothetical protein [Geminicoccaceae bacterium]